MEPCGIAGKIQKVIELLAVSQLEVIDAHSDASHLFGVKPVSRFEPLSLPIIKIGFNGNGFAKIYGRYVNFTADWER